MHSALGISFSQTHREVRHVTQDTVLQQLDHCAHWNLASFWSLASRLERPFRYRPVSRSSRACSTYRKLAVLDCNNRISICSSHSLLSRNHGWSSGDTRQSLAHVGTRGHHAVRADFDYMRRLCMYHQPQLVQELLGNGSRRALLDDVPRHVQACLS